MNKHLLNQRLKSIAHYSDELKKLNEVRELTEKTRIEIRDSLKEFWPFQKGDVIVCKDDMRRIVEANEMRDFADPAFEYKYQIPATVFSRFEWKESSYVGVMKISEIEKWRVIDKSIFE